jgi:UDP-N-acetylglucosamine:LPS N-acetylglucosamine transferase
MKILLTCSQGGHVTEMLFLMDAFDGQDVVFLMYEHPTIRNLQYKTHRIEKIDISMWRMLKAFQKIFTILKKEKPDLIVSTGSEIAIPTFVIGKMMGIKTVYIESWCRVKTKSGTGRLLYYIADVFLVQWPDLVRIYGKKARYEGGIT